MLDAPFHRGLFRCTERLNRLYREEAALHAHDCDPAGFQWLDASDRSALEAQAQDALRARGWAPDYLTVRRRADLLPATADDAAGTLVALGAARLGSTRLIDNLEF